MDLGSWLRSLGLAQYEAAFRENAINEAILPKLTAEDLRDIGVTAVGHRRVLLDAIAALRGETSPKQENAPSAATETANKPNRVGGGLPEAERRQLTVMFCDLVDSTTLSGKLDPEDLRGIISSYHRCCTDRIEGNGGFVAKYMGDGILAYFGYPQAHEHDAERAVRAGLALVEAVPKLETAIAGAILQVRVGIATGLVVVGDLIGSGEAQERGIVGETPNLAARLQAIAEPSTVVIAESTRRLLGSLFELQDLGPREFKGIAGPARAWTALRASSVESRFEALHASGLTSLVGREEESELLLRRWAKAKSGDGQVVLISGEAGIGKSRLTAALLESLASEPHTRLRYFCSPQHTDSAFYPIIGQMERAAGLAHDDAPRARLDKLDAVLLQTSISKHDAALFAEMLSLPNDGRYPQLDLTPQQRRQKALEALTSQLAELARHSQVLMIFEDAHWTDPTSLEVFGRVVDRIQTLRVLLIVTFRPEFDPPWIGQPHVSAVTINRLAQREVNAMIDRVVGNKLLPANIRQDIIERTDGIPLFVEEMTKAVLEAESEGAARRTVAAIPSPTLAVPSSLHASLMSRLDRLGTAKEVAQIGAAIGREFSHDLLASVMHETGTELGSALHRLLEAGLLFRQGVPPHASYLFKHALVRDAAYGTLLREPRRALHARIAKALTENFPETQATQPEILAHHYTEAGLIDAAVEWWGKAGQRALARPAYAEAIAHLDKAVGWSERLADVPARRLLRLRLQTGYATALMHGRGYSATETRAAFTRARELAAGVDDPTECFPVYYGLWVGALARSEVAAMRELAETFLREAEGRLGWTLFAHRCFGTTCWFQGDFNGARAHLEQVLSDYDAKRDRIMESLSVLVDLRIVDWRGHFDDGAVAMIFLANTLWTLGDVDRARNFADESLTRFTDITAIPVAPAYISIFEAMRRDAGRAMPLARAAVVRSREQGTPFWLALSTFVHSWAGYQMGDREIGLSNMRRSIANLRELGIGAWMPICAGLWAEAEADCNGAEIGLTILDDQLVETARSGQRFFDAELHRLRGEFLLRHNPTRATAAEQAFVESIDIARGQQARTFELRATLSLAKQYCATGRHRAARELLVLALVGFSEGPEFPEVGESLRLLASLDQISGTVV